VLTSSFVTTNTQELFIEDTRTSNALLHTIIYESREEAECILHTLFFMQAKTFFSYEKVNVLVCICRSQNSLFGVLVYRFSLLSIYAPCI